MTCPVSSTCMLSKLSVILFVITVTTGVAASGSSQSSAGANKETFEICRESTDLESARYDLERLDEKVRNAPSLAELSGVRTEFWVLLSSPCFRLSVESTLGMPDTDWAFKTWWEQGGHLWLESYVDRAMRALSVNEQSVIQRWVVVPPSFRNTLTFETEPEHAIAWLLCSQNDPDCGVTTAGWVERTNWAFALTAGEPMHPLTSVRYYPQAIEEERCAEAKDAEGEGSYQAWRTCIEEHRPRFPAIPLGYFKAPDKGWFAVRRRYTTVDADGFGAVGELYLFDLGSSATYVASVELCRIPMHGVILYCEELGDTLEVRAGRVNPDNVREAAWMALFTGMVQEDVSRVERYIAPEGLEPSWEVSEPGVFSSTVSVGAGWGLEIRSGLGVLCSPIALSRGRTWVGVAITKPKSTRTSSSISPPAHSLRASRRFPCQSLFFRRSSNGGPNTSKKTCRHTLSARSDGAPNARPGRHIDLARLRPNRRAGSEPSRCPRAG